MISTETPTPCQDNPDPFDAVLDRPSKATVEAAKAICVPCGHKEACYLHALSLKLPGVYGGRLLLTGVKPPKGRPPVCPKCGEERPPRADRTGWRGSKEMCDRCYQAQWRAAHGKPAKPVVSGLRLGVDTAKVERAICGETIHLHADEREAAVRLLAGQGLSDSQAAFLLRLAPETVYRIRKRCGIPAALPPGGRAS